MATATHGHQEDFDSAQEEWKTYIERPEKYFIANDVRDAGKQKVILLSCCGASTYRLIKIVQSPKRTIDVPFDDIVTQMRQFEVVEHQFDLLMRIGTKRGRV